LRKNALVRLSQSWMSPTVTSTETILFFMALARAGSGFARR
jgi:hypothetical protein